MKRREFITLLGGATVWPLAAEAQQRGPMRRIGVLDGISSDDPQSRVRHAAFLQGLGDLGRSDATSRSTSGWALHAIPALSPKWLHLLRKSY
jgi:hypothetical protein